MQNNLFKFKIKAVGTFESPDIVRLDDMTRSTYQLRQRRSGATRNVSISYSNWLSTGETLSGTPTVVADSTTISISGASVSTGVLTIDGETTSAAAAVQFTISGGTAGELITITVDVDTSASQHFDIDLQQEVI